MAIYEIIFAFLVQATTIVDSPKYWEINFPIFPGGKNATTEIDSKFYHQMHSYDIDIETEDIKLVLKFYQIFFESMGWNDPFEGREYGISADRLHVGKWSFSSHSIDKDGRPSVSFSNSWKAVRMPIAGIVSIILTDIKNSIFTARIQVQLTPDPDSKDFYEISNLSDKLSNLITNHPRNIFDLNAYHKNPYDVSTIIVPDISKFQEGDIIYRYYQLVYKIKNLYLKSGRLSIEKKPEKIRGGSAFSSLKKVLRLVSRLVGGNDAVVVKSLNYFYYIKKA